MMHWRRVAIIFGVALLGFSDASGAATREMNTNSGTVGIVTGGIDGTYVRFGSDLASVLDDGNALRVLPTIGKGSIQNINDLLYLRGIDIAIVQSDALIYAERQKMFPNMNNRVKYITKLYNEEFHILAGPGIERIEDLAGKKVNIDREGSGTFITASIVFDEMGIGVEAETNDQAVALEKLRKGDISALAYVAGKPARLFKDLKPTEGLRFLSVPLSPELLETYVPSQLTSSDYEGVIEPGAEVETVAVGAVMAVYGWDKDTERFAKVARFVDAFFSNINEFHKAPRHPKWKEVNLAAQVPGWSRFEAAKAWLDQISTTKTGIPSRNDRTSFREFVARRGIPADQADRMFENFTAWQSSTR